MTDKVDKKGSSKSVKDTDLVYPFCELAWLTHAYDGFPREVWNGDGTSRWKIMKTKEEYVSFLRDQHNNFYPSHTSINIAFTPSFGATNPWINKVLIELDGHGRLEDTAYPEMQQLYSYLASKYSADPRIYYSGNRSFHMFVDFAPISLREPKEAQVEFVRRIQDELKLQCIDYQIYANRKLSRIPYTMNEKTALYCVPIEPSWNLLDIKQEALKPLGRKRIQIRPAEKFAAALSLCDQTYERPTSPANSAKSTDWIEKLLRCPISDGRHRLLWLVLAPYVVTTKGLDARDAMEILRSYYDQCHLLNKLEPSRSSFLREIRYYVRRAARERYHPPRLETIMRTDPGLYNIVKRATESAEP